METANTATTVGTGEGTVQPSTGTQQVNQEPFIVGANSVYPDVASLFEGAKQKEAFIETLKAEKRALEDQLKAIQNINKFKEDMEKMEDNTNQTQVTTQTSELTEAKVQELALKALQQQQLEQTRQGNEQTVKDTLNKVFGAEAENKVEAKCKELGISREFAMGIAKDSPKAFLKMLGLEEPAQVTVDSIIAHGHQSAPQQPQQPMTDIQRLASDPKLARDRNFLQDLFKKANKDPSMVMDLPEWAPIGQ